jgi:uroporphyrinogen decarboxylase
MTKRERILAALKGEQVDRVPVSAWMHFPKDDSTLNGQVKALVGFQQKYDWDFAKLMYRSTFLLEDWGNTYKDYQRPLGYWLVDKKAINSAADWKKLKVLDPRKGVLNEMLLVTEKVCKALKEKEDILLLSTVFVPMMVAHQLSGGRVMQDIEEYPNEVHSALEVIAETLGLFVEACFESGCDGFFYATETASTDYLSVEKHRQFARPYDLRVLDAIQKKSEFTLFHICGKNILFDEFMDYPVDAYNWDAGATAPSLAEARKKTDKCIVGGMAKMGVIWKGTPQEVEAAARDAISTAGRNKYILAPGCGLPIDVPEGNIRSLRRAVD